MKGDYSMWKSKIIYLLILLMCISVLSACDSSEKAKEQFVSKIAEIHANYNKAKDASDALAEDVNMKVALGDLRELAKMYEEAEDKTEFNIILDSKLSSTVFYEILEHQEDYIAHSNGTDDYILTFKDALLKFYSSK